MSKHLHYSWIICLSGMILIFLTMGMVNNGFSVFLPYLRDAYGFSNTQTSILIDLRCAASFVGMFIVGFYYKELGLRLGTCLAAFLVTIGFGFYTFAEEHYLLYCIGSSINGLGYGLGSMIPVSILMNNWFIDNVSLAIGICASGSGVATIIMPPLITRYIETQSIQNAFSFEAVIALIICGLVVAFVREHPFDMDTKPYRKPKKRRHHDSAVSASDEGEDVDESLVLRLKNKLHIYRAHHDRERRPAPVMIVSKRVWIFLVIASFIMGILASPAFAHLPLLFAEGGFSSGTTAMLISLAGAILTVSKIVFGRVVDKIGAYRAFMIFGAITLGGMALLCLTPSGNLTLVIAGVLLLGLGISTATVAIPCWARDFASANTYGRVIKRLEILYALGALAFTSMPGILADLTGSYVISYFIFAAAVALAMLMIFLSYKRPASTGEESI